jgi:hypothetical protein
MGGKGKGKTRVKRKEVQTEDGWTVITHGLSNMSLDAGSLPSHVVEGLTAERLKGDFEKLQERWEDSGLAGQVKGILEKGEWDVREAVCVGVGSFSRDWVHRWRSLWQLVLFAGVVEGCKFGFRVVLSDLKRAALGFTLGGTCRISKPFSRCIAGC